VIVSELEACHRLSRHHVRFVGYDAYTQEPGLRFVVFRHG